MSFIWHDRVMESVSVSGTGDVNLSDTPPDSTYFAFEDRMANGDTSIITIVGGGHYETCHVTFASGTPNRLVRGAVIESSNGDAPVSFGGGSKTAIMTMPGRLATRAMLAAGLMAQADVAVADRLTTSEQAVARANIGASPLVHDNVLCPHQGLTNKWVSNSTVDIDATAVVLFDSNGNGRQFGPLDETLDITASGANGLDTGSEGASRWYHIWAIGKADGTLDGLLSESASAPTLPAGYTYKGYIGAIYNDGSSNLIGMAQVGEWATRIAQAVLAGGTATSFTPVNLAAAVPPAATMVELQVTLRTSSGSHLVSCNLSPHASGGVGPFGTFILRELKDTNESICPGFVLLTTPQEIYYAVSGTNALVNLSVIKWKF